MKIVLAIPISIFFVFFYIFYVVMVCLLSSLIFGVLGWMNVLQNSFKQTRVANIEGQKAINVQSSDSSLASCFIIICWLFFLPPAILIFAIVGFFIPFWNICYPRKIVLESTILIELWQSMHSWIDVYILLWPYINFSLFPFYWLPMESVYCVMMMT